MIFVASYFLIGFLVNMLPLFIVDPTKDPIWKSAFMQLEIEFGLSLDHWYGVTIAGILIFFLLIILWPLVILDFVRSL